MSTSPLTSYVTLDISDQGFKNVTITRGGESGPKATLYTISTPPASQTVPLPPTSIVRGTGTERIALFAWQSPGFTSVTYDGGDVSRNVKRNLHELFPQKDWPSKSRFVTTASGSKWTWSNKKGNLKLLSDSKLSLARYSPASKGDPISTPTLEVESSVVQDLDLIVMGWVVMMYDAEFRDDRAGDKWSLSGFLLAAVGLDVGSGSASAVRR